MGLIGDFIDKLLMRRPPRQQYAALCYRQNSQSEAIEVLLLTSRDTGRWVIPKGWPMEGKQAHDVAAQEAYEEAGVKGTVEPQTFGFYDYDKKLRNGVIVSCRVEVHLMHVAEICRNFPEKDERRFAWVAPQEAAKRVNEPQLKQLFSRFGRVITTA